ncbi:hypothetical protein HZZ00_06400 [Streptomyces sp. NEAU-sy36]|uniref:hypothetical protein n=1 Tax=unclassified Streptomyces TaxID=2593676 RepID=UPI0015D59CAE|nr:MULTISPECIES: hypothetical protein [unclassified Streptomyces]QLJ00655.1 hypothetical protein HZZ00_06400 [Streptomyces sp. NEAU-sy36]
MGAGANGMGAEGVSAWRAGHGTGNARNRNATDEPARRGGPAGGGRTRRTAVRECRTAAAPAALAAGAPGGAGKGRLLSVVPVAARDRAEVVRELADQHIGTGPVRHGVRAYRLAPARAVQAGDVPGFRLKALAPVSGPYYLLGTQVPAMTDGRVNDISAVFYQGAGDGDFHRGLGHPAGGFADVLRADDGACAWKLGNARACERTLAARGARVRLLDLGAVDRQGRDGPRRPGWRAVRCRSAVSGPVAVGPAQYQPFACQKDQALTGLP